MSLLVVIEILNEDGSEVTDDPHGREFDIAQLKLMEQDRQDDGYVNLDGTNYVFNSRIVGVAQDLNAPPPADLRMVFIQPIETAL
jgi:hypothetical protein